MLAPGSRIGPFEVLAPLGAGGMGEVYRARDLTLRREVALKTLPEAVAREPNRLARLRREARILASLSHPGIATLHGLEESGDGVPVLVMELVRGETLADRLHRGPLPLKDVLAIGHQIAEALAAAHQKGVLHRDLKPANISLTPEGRIKLLDFGLARALEEDEIDLRSQLSTATSPASDGGRVIGTAPYMSPEQARGQEVDRRSDIWSFGCVLYELLTGRRSFPGATFAETAVAVLEREPDWGALPETTPVALRRLVQQCLKKDRDERLRDAADAGLGLREMTSELSSGNQSRATTNAILAGDQRLRIKKLASGLALGLVLGVLGFLAVRGSRARIQEVPDASPIRSLAVLPLDNLSADPEQEFFADGMTDALITELSKLGALRVISRTSTISYKKGDKPLPQVAQELGVDAIVEGSVLRSGERVRITAQLVRGATDEHVWAEEYERDIRDVLSLQREVARAIARQIQVKLTPDEQARLAEAAPVDLEANELYLKGVYYYNEATGTLKPPEVRKLLEQSVDSLQASIQRAPDYAASHAALARSYVLLANRVGTHLLLDARAAARRALEIDPDQADAHVVTGFTALQLDWDWAGAERHYQRAIELSPNLAEAHRGYANLLSQLGRSDAAIAEIERAQQLDPLRLLIRAETGQIYASAGQHDRAIAIYRALRAKDPQNFAMPWALGGALIGKGSYEEGLAEYRSAVKAHEGNPAPLAALAFAYARSGQKDEARKILAGLRERGEDHGSVLIRFAGAHVALGETDEAMACLERAYRERESMVLNIPTSPFLKPLQSDPRYQDLVRKIGWPGAAKR
jgi:serine/threonine-protein kinase